MRPCPHKTVVIPPYQCHSKECAPLANNYRTVAHAPANSLQSTRPCFIVVPTCKPRKPSLRSVSPPDLVPPCGSRSNVLSPPIYCQYELLGQLTVSIQCPVSCSTSLGIQLFSFLYYNYTNNGAAS